jgi:TolB protein
MKRSRHFIRAALVLTLGLAMAARVCAQDRARIVFSGQIGSRITVFLTTPEGAWFEELTEDPAWNAAYHSPVWSHDGACIALSSYRGGPHSHIYVMDADGNRLRPITDGQLDRGPTWSPRADAIAYTWRDRNRAGSVIRVVDVEGRREARPVTAREAGAEAYEADWRPSGHAIVYSGSQAASGLDLHVVDASGLRLGQLTDGDAYDMAPAWHPRGRAVAFTRATGRFRGVVDIYAVDADGSNERRVTTHPAKDSSPSWSPDGTQILFTSDRDGAPGLFIMDADGSRVRNVTDGRFSNISGASWFDPEVARSVSPIGRRATTWGWLRRLEPRAR